MRPFPPRRLWSSCRGVRDFELRRPLQRPAAAGGVAGGAMEQQRTTSAAVSLYFYVTRCHLRPGQPGPPEAHPGQPGPPEAHPEPALTGPPPARQVGRRGRGPRCRFRRSRTDPPSPAREYRRPGRPGPAPARRLSGPNRSPGGSPRC